MLQSALAIRRGIFAGDDPLVTVEQTVEIMAILDAAERSVQAGATVTLS